MKSQAITQRQPKLITNPLFVNSLLLLIINDFLLKAVFHNWLTGKLSDFSGIIVLALLLAYFIPKLSGKAALVSGIIFIFWKSPLASPTIYLANVAWHIPLRRVIDYTDLFALSLIPFIWIFIERLDTKAKMLTWPVYYRNLLVLSGTVASIATTMSPKQKANHDGTIEIYKDYSLNVPKESVLSRLKTLGYQVEPASEDSTNYLIRQVVFSQQDTLKSIRFKLENKGTKCKLSLETVQATHPLRITSFNEIKKRYKELVESGIVAKVAN